MLKHKDITNSLPQQLDIYDHYYKTFVELAVNRFRWKNLPASVDPRYLEFGLLRSGLVVFFYDPVRGYTALEGAGYDIDIYGNPKSYQCVTPTTFQARVDSDMYNINVEQDGVPVWNNFMRCGDMGDVVMFAGLIADVMQSALVNIHAQKHPVVVVAPSEKEKLSMSNVYKDYAGNSPVIFAKSKNLTENITTLNTQAPYVADRLMEQKDKLVEEFMKWLGVRMPLVNGRDRLVAREQLDANAVTFQLRNRGLHSRQIAAEQINRLYPELNLEVEFNDDVSTLALDLLGTGEGEDLDDEQI